MNYYTFFFFLLLCLVGKCHYRHYDTLYTFSTQKNTQQTSNLDQIQLTEQHNCQVGGKVVQQLSTDIDCFRTLLYVLYFSVLYRHWIFPQLSDSIATTGKKRMKQQELERYSLINRKEISAACSPILPCFMYRFWPCEKTQGKM